MVAGGEIEARYDVPPDAWYFAAERQGRMPFAVLLEAALQPCGWLAAYLGSALTSDDEFWEECLHLQGDRAGLGLAAPPRELRHQRVLAPSPQHAADPTDTGSALPERGARPAIRCGSLRLHEQGERQRLDVALQARVSCS